MMRNKKNINNNKLWINYKNDSYTFWIKNGIEHKRKE